MYNPPNSYQYYYTYSHINIPFNQQNPYPIQQNQEYSYSLLPKQQQNHISLKHRYSYSELSNKKKQSLSNHKYSNLNQIPPIPPKNPYGQNSINEQASHQIPPIPPKNPYGQSSINEQANHQYYCGQNSNIYKSAKRIMHGRFSNIY